MATDLERLVVQLTADIKKFESAFNRAAGFSNKKMTDIEKRSQQLSQNIERAFNKISFGGLNNALTSIGVALGTREIAAYADEWTRAGNLLRSSAVSSNVGVRTLNEIKDSANSARASVSEYVELYARLIRAAAPVAKSEQEIALATDLVSKAFKAGGAAAQEQAAGILQLGQALGSGVLQGDELRSLRENAPIIAKAIANEFKTTVAGLKQLGAEGKLTSDRVFRAIINAQKPIEAQFKATNATIKDAFTQVNNEFLAFIGNADQSAGASAKLVEALQYVADNFKGIADTAVQFAQVLITVLAGRAIGGLAASLVGALGSLGAFLPAMRTGAPIVASFAAALGPIGLLAGAAAAAIILLNSALGSGQTSSQTFNDSIKANEKALIGAADASRNYQVQLAKQIELQLEAAKAEYELADAASEAASRRATAFKIQTGFRFAPFEYEADQATKNADRLGLAMYKLEEQAARAKKILESTPSGFGGGVDVPADEKKKKAKKTPEERFSDRLQDITDRTAATIAETEALRGLNPLINDYGYAAEKARTEIELLNAAQKAGVKITPELRKEIAATAEQWALANVEANKLAESQDKIRQRAEEWRDTQKDALRGIVDDLIQGKSAADAFANALQKIGNKLLDMAFDDLFTGLFKSGGSGGGGIFGQIGKLFGFANGGYTGSGPRNQPKGIVHAGEVVWSQQDIARAGGVSAVEALRNGTSMNPVAMTAPTMPNLKSGGSSSQNVTINFNPKIDATGADAAALGRVEDQLKQMKQELPATVIQTVRKAQNQNVKLG